MSSRRVRLHASRNNDDGNHSYPVIEQFVQMLADEGKSANTLDTYRRHLKSFAQWSEHFQGTFDLRSIEPRDIHRYFAHLRTTKRIKPATFNLSRAVLSAFFNWAIEQNLRDENPARTVKKATAIKGAPKALSEEQMDRLLAAARDFSSKRDGAIVLTLLLTGLRESELASLLLQDLDFSKQILTVYAGKGGKYREVPIPSILCDVLQRYLSGERAKVLARYKRPLKRPHLFIGQRGAITRRTVNRAVDAVGMTAGIKCHPHMLRHTYATFILNKTGDLTAVSALLGHSSIATTQIYTRPTQELLAERVHSALGNKGKS